jgi:hypothetical protein
MQRRVTPNTLAVEPTAFGQPAPHDLKETKWGCGSTRSLASMSTGRFSQSDRLPQPSFFRGDSKISNFSMHSFCYDSEDFQNEEETRADSNSSHEYGIAYPGHLEESFSWTETSTAHPWSTEPYSWQEFNDCSQSRPGQIGSNLQISSIREPSNEASSDKNSKKSGSTLNEKTTILIRNIPCKYTLQELLREVRAVDRPFDFLYLPQAKRSRGNLGFGFVNFLTNEDAIGFVKNFQNHLWVIQPNSAKRADPIFANLQGFKKNVEFYSSKRIRAKSKPFVDYEAHAQREERKAFLQRLGGSSCSDVGSIPIQGEEDMLDEEEFSPDLANSSTCQTPLTWSINKI